MHNIQNLAEYIERLACTSLYDLNAANQKLAEQELTNFIFQLNPDHYGELLESSSENVVFAFGAVLLKNVGNVKEHIHEILPRVSDILMRWYQPNGILKQQNGDDLKLYIQNTYGQFMGNSLRVLFNRVQNREVVNRFLDGLSIQPRYRLFLYFRFIESFSNVSQEMSYVEYRTLLNSFQQSFIPRIFEALFPYFMSISDEMDINELSFLHNSLSVGEEQQSQCQLQFSAKNRFTEIVFELLTHVIMFRYNITSREYEELQEFENVVISFPEPLLACIMRQNFLEALFNILLQLMRTNEFKYQQTCLKCLKKILLAKISYIVKDMQTPFYFHNMQGVSSLLKLILANKVTNRLNAVNIIQCNFNFIHTFGFSDIDEKAKDDERYGEIFRMWLQATRSILPYILQGDSTSLTSENDLFLAATEMNAQLLNELKISEMVYDKTAYAENYRTITNIFLDKFVVKAKSILGSKPFSFQELKKSSKDVLSNIKVVFTCNYNETFNILNTCCEYFFKLDADEFGLGNFILLIDEMIRENSFLEESVFGKGILNSRQLEMEEVSGQIQMFSHILARTLTFISRYQNESSYSSLYVNSAMVVFLSTLLKRCSCQIQIGEEEKPIAPFIGDELCKRIKFCLQCDDDEKFILSCLYALAKFIRSPRMTNIDFIFEKLYEIIRSIKFGMKREHFKKSAIYTEMLNLFSALSQQVMPLEFMKWRVLLFKIITFLSFDDLLDEYRGCIRNAVALIKTSILQSQWVKVLYDLTGIFETIDGKVIYRYFVRYLVREINFEVLIKELYVSLGFANPNAYLKDVLHLSWVMIENQHDRIHGEDGAFNVYGMLSLVIPYWNQCLSNENILDEGSLMEIYTAFTTIINGKHINICLLDQINKVVFRQFVKYIILSMCKIIQTIETSAQLATSCLSLAILITDKVVKQLFNLEDMDVGKGINYLVNQLMRKLRSSFQIISGGLFEENLLEPMLKAIDQHYGFMRANLKKYHLTYMMANIDFVLQETNEKELFLEGLIKIAMDFRQDFTSTIQHIANICVNLIDFYKIDPLILVERLGLNEGRDIQEFKRIFSHIREAKEDYEWLTLQMKDWLKHRGRFSSFIPFQY